MIKEKGLKISNSKKDSFIMTLTHVHTIEPTNEKVISIDNPLYIRIDGINGKGVILKGRDNRKVEKMDEEESSGI